MWYFQLVDSLLGTLSELGSISLYWARGIPKLIKSSSWSVVAWSIAMLYLYRLGPGLGLVNSFSYSGPMSISWYSPASMSPDRFWFTRVLHKFHRCNWEDSSNPEDNLFFYVNRCTWIRRDSYVNKAHSWRTLTSVMTQWSSFRNRFNTSGIKSQFNQ